jgi:hypothetical protein
VFLYRLSSLFMEELIFENKFQQWTKEQIMKKGQTSKWPPEVPDFIPSQTIRFWVRHSYGDYTHSFRQKKNSIKFILKEKSIIIFDFFFIRFPV